MREQALQRNEPGVTAVFDANAPPALIGVTVIEDHREIREGLAALIEGAPGYRCTGRYRSMEEAVAAPVRAAPDVILLDIRLPGMSGLDGIPLLKERYPGASVLILTVYDDDQRVFAAMCAGACGYLLKKTPPSRLLESIREVADGGAAMSPEIARRVVTLFHKIRPPTDADYGLTPHEVRLLKLFVDGHNYKTAAAALGVTVHAVSFHLRSIYEKLRVHSKTEAVAKAIRHRLLD
jgi:DNA-binding NarL/FixJ family response regulator